MNQGLDDESRAALIEYRISRAEETIGDAELLLANERYIAAVNRLYYACYYAAVALLLKNRIVTKTHEGVKHQLGLLFVKTGMLPTSMSRFYSKLFNDRITGDYDDFVEYDREKVEVILEQSREFVSAIKEMLLSQ